MPRWPVLSMITVAPPGTVPTENLADIAGVVDVRAQRTYADNVTGCGDVAAGESTQCDVAAAGGVEIERINTDGRVEAAGTVAKEHKITADGRVARAGGIESERTSTDGRVNGSGGIA